MLKRKFVTGSITSSIYAVVLGFIMSFDSGQSGLVVYLHTVTLLIPVGLLYSLPLILSYGVAASFVSEWAGGHIAKIIGQPKAKLLFSGLLHMFFGLIFMWVSLGAAFIFFAVDLFLKRRKKHFTWGIVYRSFLLPIGIGLSFLIILWVVGGLVKL
ncbi:hypothetical protein LC065_00785 [Halobacillus litoralis]|uniref:hypothetical protein n=1 Tax=Halobacillus litoralis TaxID=45668 RepID=UPI001CFD3684|nr:hypothetical protein [Halobacillus litoralis]WLR47866.1 hypothetical protein LC065_00785 [Halobacillus litoralis]